MKVWTKDPDENLDFRLDWSDELGEDAIATSAWVDVDAGITVGATTNTATTTTIWLSGGTAGTAYEMTNRITTTGGRSYERTVVLSVVPTVGATDDGLPVFNGCDWPLAEGMLTDAWFGHSDAIRQMATSLASATLYRLTGYRVGGCPVTVRPTSEIGSCATEGRMSPANWGGRWTNVLFNHTSDPRLVDLPAPVGRVDSVKVDGVVINPALYTIVDGHYLAWTGAPGTQPWPRQQDWLIPDTEPGTFSVTYLNGYEVDGHGAIAAALLAMEFASALATGGKKCKLPSNIISIVRQGVTYELAAGAFPDGKTTIREVDAFIEVWNPKNRQPGVVINPNTFGKVHVQR